MNKPDRFETVLPDSLRRRYRVPQVRSEFKVPPPRRTRILKRSGESLPVGIILLASAVAMLAASGVILWQVKEIQQPQNAKPVSAPKATYTPAPTLTPPPIPEATPEVRRAEPVPSEATTIYGTVLAHMPDGEVIRARPVGNVTRQEELPLTGNKVGDAYFVGNIPFVWTQLANGQGAWIDPQLK